MRFRRQPETDLSASEECFFCGERQSADADDIIFMSIWNQAGSRVGAWPCHERCVEANRHSNAGDLQRL
jgi:hypothetical protein